MLLHKSDDVMIKKRTDITDAKQTVVDYFFYTKSPIAIEGHNFDIVTDDLLTLCDECDFFPYKHKGGPFSKVCSACVACDIKMRSMGKDVFFKLKEVKE